MTSTNDNGLSKGGRTYRALRSTALRAAIRLGRDVLAWCRPPAWYLEGCARGSGLPLAILFTGQLENKNYLAHLAFAPSPTERALGRRWIGSVFHRTAMAEDQQPDIRIAELDAWQRRLLRDRFRFFVPCWVGGEIDIAPAVQHIRKSKNAKEDLRRIRRDRMTYEIARGAADFEQFYFRMYQPYIAKLYGDRAFSMSYEEMMHQRERSELFLVKKDGEPVAGLILRYDAENPRAWSLGIKDGDRALVKAGALRALDYLLFFYLAEKGHAKVHMGASRPFLKDGVLRHKRRIGLRICGSTARGFAISPAAASPAAQAFLVDNPFIFENNGAYAGAVFVDVDSKPAPSAEQLRQWRSEYETPGLHGIVVLAAGNGEEVEPLFAAPAASSYARLSSPMPPCNHGIPRDRLRADLIRTGKRFKSARIESELRGDA
jgi:hypothetical protein